MARHLDAGRSRGFAGTAEIAINRFGTWRSMVGGFSLLCASSIGLGLATSKLLLLPLAVGYGASLAFLVNPVLPFIMDHERADQRQHASAVSLSVVNLSLMIGSLDRRGLAPNFFARIIPSIGEGRWQRIGRRC